MVEGRAMAEDQWHPESSKRHVLRWVNDMVVPWLLLCGGVGAVTGFVGGLVWDTSSSLRIPPSLPVRLLVSFMGSVAGVATGFLIAVFTWLFALMVISLLEWLIRCSDRAGKTDED
jgi:hypothetical protein